MGIRRSHKKSRSSRVLFILACVLVGVAALYYANTVLNTDPVARIPEPADKFLPLSAEDERLAEEARLVYPYSVIPGGIRSTEELAAYIATDKVVADHFSDFVVRRARIVEAENSRMMHVSYRVGDQVYWTQNKVRIPEGEMLVTDGDCEARLRCGNRVSATPMDPVADEEPMVETFDMPQLVRMIPPKLPRDLLGDPLIADLDLDAMPEYIPPPFSDLDLGVVSIPDRTPPPSPMRQIDSELLLPEILSEFIPVPEPGILLLLTTGLAAIFALRLFGKNQD